MDFTPRYEPLPASEKGEEELYTHHRKPLGKKKLLLYLLSLSALVYASFRAARFVGSKGFLGTCFGFHKSKANLSKLPTHYTLPSGDQVPALALGTALEGRGDVRVVVKTALRVGFRHIDASWDYDNEDGIGEALRESDVPREELWLTSKLANNFHAPEDVEAAVDDSLSKLGTDYLDLYLIHWPVAFKKDDPTVLDRELTENPYPTWQKLEELVDKGKLRNIGVSNFNVRRFENLTANPLKYQPAVNQVELNFWNPQPEFLEWSKERGLLLGAFSPLGADRLAKKSLDVPEVKEIASKLGITPSQVLISWQAQRGVIVLPKSVKPSHIVENFQVFELPQEDFDRLEKAAASHPPQRAINPSKLWDLPFDIFDGE